MVSQRDIGVSGPEYRFVIEEGKVREFASAIGWRLDPGSEPIIPPTFLGVAGRWWGYTLDEPGQTDLSRIEIDRSLLLHAEEEYEFHGAPPRAGDEYAVRTFVKECYEKTGKRGGRLIFVVTETEYRNKEGGLAAIGRQTVVQTETSSA